jgi:phosphoglycolate phosphatase
MAKAILFDLDGTLADTAPDLAAALNQLRSEDGLAPMPLSALRPHASHGVRGMLEVGLGVLPGSPRYQELTTRFLDHYAAGLCISTRLFDGIEELLIALESRCMAWGIVTNKHARYTRPLLEALGLTERAACIVSGDSAPRPKPAPDPLLLAAQQIGLAPAACIYVGDDIRDIRAGKAAGMRTIAARYGYLGLTDAIDEWQADWIIDHPDDVLMVIEPAG